MYRIIVPPPIINFWKIFQSPPTPILFQPPLLLISKILASHKIKSHRFFVWNSKKELTSYWVIILNYIHATKTKWKTLTNLHAPHYRNESETKKIRTRLFSFRFTFAFIMYLVSIILLLYYIGTKKKGVIFYTSPQLFQPLPLLLVFGEIFNPPPPIIPNPPIIRYSRVTRLNVFM